MSSLNLSFAGHSQTNTQARLEAFVYQVKDFQAWRGAETAAGKH